MWVARLELLSNTCSCHPFSITIFEHKNHPQCSATNFSRDLLTRPLNGTSLFRISRAHRHFRLIFIRALISVTMFGDEAMSKAVSPRPFTQSRCAPRSHSRLTNASSGSLLFSTRTCRGVFRRASLASISAPQFRSSHAVDKHGYLFEHLGVWVKVFGLLERNPLAGTINVIIVCRCTVAQTQVQERGPVDLGDQSALVDLMELFVDLSPICRRDACLHQDLRKQKGGITESYRNSIPDWRL